MIELIALILLIGVVLYWTVWSKEEGFTGNPSTQETPYLLACPGVMIPFYRKDGTPACCSGPLTEGQCRFSRQCVMTGNGTADVPNCKTIVDTDFQTNSNEMCPPSMTTYFENVAENKKGCTAGSLRPDNTGPATTSQPMCKIYPTMDDNLSNADSCALNRELETTPCFGTNCTKFISPSSPPLISIQFQDEKGMNRTVHTRRSVTYYLEKTQPAWRESGLDLNKNINIAEVAKAYFVDKTLTVTDIQI